MSRLDLSKIRQLALEKGIDDQYLEYIRFSDFKCCFNGFVIRLISDLEEIGIKLSEGDIIDRIFPILKLTIKTIYEGGFVEILSKNAKEKIRGEFIPSIVENIASFVVIFLIYKIANCVNVYINHKLIMKKLKDYHNFLKNELNMNDEQVNEFLLKIAENVEKSANSSFNPLDLIRHFLK